MLIADDMGLGKTLQAIAVMNYYRSDWPFLIICPSSVKLTWAEVSQYALILVSRIFGFVVVWELGLTTWTSSISGSFAQKDLYGRGYKIPKR